MLRSLKVPLDARHHDILISSVMFGHNLLKMNECFAKYLNVNNLLNVEGVKSKTVLRFTTTGVHREAPGGGDWG